MIRYRLVAMCGRDDVVGLAFFQKQDLVAVSSILKRSFVAAEGEHCSELLVFGVSSKWRGRRMMDGQKLSGYVVRAAIATAVHLRWSAYVDAIVAPENRASQVVLSECGFRLMGEVRGWSPVLGRDCRYLKYGVTP